MGILNVISRSEEPFLSRQEAGKLLALKLKKYSGQDVVVLGVPRGGVVVAKEIADTLSAKLDIVLSRKIGAPANEEFAIGAITEEGKLFLNTDVLSQIGVNNDYIEKEKARQLAEIARRTSLYRKVLPKVSLRDKIVIVTDDGVATGTTLQAALWAVRQERPKKLIVGLPVGPEEAIKRLSKDADEMIVLRMPDFFSAVGQFYMNFSQVEDEEILETLKEWKRRGDIGNEKE